MPAPSSSDHAWDPVAAADHGAVGALFLAIGGAHRAQVHRLMISGRCSENSRLAVTPRPWYPGVSGPACVRVTGGQELQLVTISLSRSVSCRLRLCVSPLCSCSCWSQHRANRDRAGMRVAAPHLSAALLGETELWRTITPARRTGPRVCVPSWPRRSRVEYRRDHVFKLVCVKESSRMSKLSNCPPAPSHALLAASAAGSDLDLERGCRHSNILLREHLLSVTCRYHAQLSSTHAEQKSDFEESWRPGCENE